MSDRLAKVAISQLAKTVAESGTIYLERYSAQRFFVWVKQPFGKWIQYQIYNHIDPTINVNVWRMYDTLLGDLTNNTPISIPSLLRGGKVLQNAVTPMSQTVQWEYAMQPEGAPDFFGGYHGDEQVQEVQFLMNGKTFTYSTMNTNQIKKGTRFELIQKTFVYNPTDHTTKLGEITVRHIITSEGLTIKWKLNWTADINIIGAYGGMLPIKRNANNGVHYCRFTDETTIHDISVAGNPIPSKNTNEVELYNNGNSLSARVTINPVFFNSYTKSNNFGLWVSNDSTYNKVYPTRVHTSQTEAVTNGSSWECEVTYSLYLPEP
jgi:hypothetical protein